MEWLMREPREKSNEINIFFSGGRSGVGGGEAGLSIIFFFPSFIEI